MKPELHPPGSPRSQRDTDTQNFRWLWLSLAAVLLLGLLVIFALPRLVSQPPSGLATPVPDSMTAPAIIDTQAASAAANQAMQAYLKLRAKLELENVSGWGEPDWGQAATTAASGARLLAQRQFVDAAANYTLALQTLEQLYGGRDARLAAALAAGEEALASNAIDSATEQFNRVLVIEPGHPAATLGLAPGNGTCRGAAGHARG